MFVLSEHRLSIQQSNHWKYCEGTEIWCCCVKTLQCCSYYCSKWKISLLADWGAYICDERRTEYSTVSLWISEFQNVAFCLHTCTSTETVTKVMYEFVQVSYALETKHWSGFGLRNLFPKYVKGPVKISCYYYFHYKIIKSLLKCQIGMHSAKNISVKTDLAMCLHLSLQFVAKSLCCN
jgi:hypothetical protein